MAKKPHLTRAQKAILKAPKAEVRRVTLAEKLANPGRFSLRGEYVVPTKIKKVTSRTAFTTLTRRKDYLEGVSHGKAAAERAQGLRPYRTFASEEQAAKTREVARIKRELKTTKEAERPWKIPKGPRKGETKWIKENVTDSAKQNYLEWRRRKLAGQWIDDGEWHQMMTAARAVNDPMLNLLMKS
jgi:hypothetical protein